MALRKARLFSNLTYASQLSSQLTTAVPYLFPPTTLLFFPWQRIHPHDTAINTIYCRPPFSHLTVANMFYSHEGEQTRLATMASSTH